MKRLVVAAAVLAAIGTSPAPAGVPPMIPEPSYYRPVVTAGMTFPVARSNWYSIVEFTNDWHEPRMRKIGGKWRQVGFHEGLDITAEKGTPILALMGGTVERTGWTFYSGDRIGVRGRDGRYYFYAHVSAFAPGIRPGARVETGSVLGAVGNTGYGPPGHEDEFPPHLHIGIQEAGGEWVNPFPLVTRLYRRATERTSQGERELAELAGDGDREGFDRLAAGLYAEL